MIIRDALLPRIIRRSLMTLCAPPEVVADGVWLIRGGATRTMNAYLIRDPDTGGITVFDTGERGMARGIAAAAQSLGGLEWVVLGHADTDHRGAAPQLRALAPVACHPDAVEHAQGSGGRAYWNMARLPLGVRLLHGIMHRLVWDGGPVTIDATLREGDTVAGFEVVELAGHAPGQIGLWRHRDRVALVSDCVYLIDMHGRSQPASVPLDAYNHDSAAARAAVTKLAALQPKTVLAGHGAPLTGEACRRELRRVTGQA